MPGRKAQPINIMAERRRIHRSSEQLQNRSNFAPKVASSELKCPAHLCPAARKEWKRLVKLYQELEEPIITDLDVHALEIYCETLVTYRKATQKVREFSEVYTSRTDPSRPRINPWFSIAADAANQMKKFSDILLMDPVSRAKVGLAKTRKEDLSPM